MNNKYSMEFDFKAALKNLFDLSKWDENEKNSDSISKEHNRITTKIVYETKLVESKDINNRFFWNIVPESYISVWIEHNIKENTYSITLWKNGSITIFNENISEKEFCSDRFLRKVCSSIDDILRGYVRCYKCGKKIWLKDAQKKYHTIYAATYCDDCWGEAEQREKMEEGR